MRKNSECTYWMSNKSWYVVNEEKDCFELTETAPPKARESFVLWSGKEKRGIRKIVEAIIK